MKRIILILFIANVNFLYAQLPCNDYYYLNFEDTQCLGHVYIDTTLPGNIWQIGEPQKPFFNNAYTTPNVIIDRKSVV